MRNGPSYADIAAAGGVRSVCFEFARLGGRKSDWITARLFAEREFRGAHRNTINAVMRLALAASNAGKAFDRCKDKRKVPRIAIPKLPRKR